MCGRYGLAVDGEALADALGLEGELDLAPRFNIAPTQSAPVVREEGEGKALAMLRWGLVPSWARDAKIASRTINARSETVAEKPSFRAAFRSRRCLVPADGWFEWQGAKGSRAPYWVQRTDGAPFAMAGLWECWQSPVGEVIESFTVLTTDALANLRALHHRMPLILRREDHDAWMDPARTPAGALSGLIDSIPAAFDFFPVSPLVNHVANDAPQCRQRRLELPL